ncbi:HTH_Tnp_Tc3_2 domain-containing protein [Trichonephila clavipes]|nr:HTH_Tnp_Tc3_2 domain-containing protein [Trichonephila clavipes]
MPHLRSRNANQHVSNLDKCRIVAYRYCGLSYRSTVARVGRYPVAFSRMWNQWVQDVNTESHAEYQRPFTTSTREDRHVIRMTIKDRAAPSRALSQELGSFARQKVPARTVRRRLH